MSKKRHRNSHGRENRGRSKEHRSLNSMSEQLSQISHEMRESRNRQLRREAEHAEFDDGVFGFYSAAGEVPEVLSRRHVNGLKKTARAWKQLTGDAEVLNFCKNREDSSIYTVSAQRICQSKHLHYDAAIQGRLVVHVYHKENSKLSLRERRRA